MQSHLTIKANGKHLALPDDFSIDLDYQNPMFNDAESFSYPCEIPIKGNGNLLKNVADRKADMRPVDLEDTKARIYADGLPIFDGKLKTSDDEELDTALSMNIEGGETLEDLVSSLDCRDITIPDKYYDNDELLIGEKVSKVSVDGEGTVYIRVNVAVQNGTLTPGWPTGDMACAITGQTVHIEVEPQALGFSVPCKCTEYLQEKATVEKSVATGIDNYVQNTPKKIESYINVADPYPTKMYCNAQVAYKHYDLDDNGETSDSVMSNPYMVLDADRPQSGICFYVMFFLDCLFEYLGLEWDNRELSKIEDFNRLCFYNTKCSYALGDTVTEEHTAIKAVNEWLSSRGCGGYLSLVFDKNDQATVATIPAGTRFETSWLAGTFTQDAVLTADSASTLKPYTIHVHLDTYKYPKRSLDVYQDVPLTEIRSYITQSWSNTSITNVDVTYAKMYADSGNWPDASVSTILESLENQFGIRFVYNAEQKKVTAKLLRDLYRNQSAPKTFLGQIHEMHKVSEKITGVRVCYSNESDSKEQKNNLRDQTRDYDTNYDYIDYPVPGANKMQGTSIACDTVLDKKYEEICKSASNTDNTCYIDVNTGNAYRIKIDSEASTTSEMKPAWFEVGQFKGVEMGDCSEKNEDYVVEYASDFEPLILSDVNSANVRAAAGTSAISNKKNQPNLVAYCDEDMEHEYVKQILKYPANNVYGDVYLSAALHLRESYNPEDSDDGNSPLQSYDWGLAIAIMRGGGNEATTYTYDTGYDGFDNSKWGQTVGNYALTVDSIDQLGNHYDYNGEGDNGEGRGERFSLKIRAFKGELTTWASEKNADGSYKYGSAELCDPDTHSDDEGWYYIRNRGTFDRFMYEHAYFLLHRRKFIVRASVTPAFLQDIRNHWTDRWKILDETGFINKVSVSVDIKKGVQEAEIEFYAL